MKKIALIAPNWLGDAVMSLPLVGLVGNTPGVRLAVCATGYVARVYMGLDAVAELLIVERRGRLRRVTGPARRLRRLGAAGAVLLPPSFSSALALFLSRIPERVGYAFDGRTPLLTAALPSRGFREVHLAESYLELGRTLLRRLEIPPPSNASRPAVHICAREREAVEALLKERAGSPEEFCVIVPGAAYGPAKTWPRQNYRRLLELLSPHLPVVLGGSAGERPLCDRLAAGLPHVYNLAGRTSLGEFAALLDAARIVVANDSGAPHLAGAVGTPVVVLFGSTSPTWTAPRGERVEIISGTASCAPCFLEECPTALECFNSITPDLVMERIGRVLEKKSR